MARIIALSQTQNLSYLEPEVSGFRKANPQGAAKTLGPAVPP